MNAHEVAEAERIAEQQRRALAGPITLEQMIACVRREIAMRKRVYPRWVADGRKARDDAEREIATMQAVHDTLAALPPTQGALNL